MSHSTESLPASPLSAGALASLWDAIQRRDLAALNHELAEAQDRRDQLANEADERVAAERKEEPHYDDGECYCVWCADDVAGEI